MKNIIAGCMALTIASCTSAGKLAAEQAARQEQARQERIKLLEDMRKAYPCDEVKLIPGQTVYLPGDSLPCPFNTPDGTKGSAVYVKCPDQEVRVDTILKLDTGWLKQYRDSLESERYGRDIARQNANEQSKRAEQAEEQLKGAVADAGYWWRLVLISGGVLGILAGGAIINKIRDII